MSPLKHHLTALEDEAKKGDLTLSTVVAVFGIDGHFVLIFFLILPFLQPIPLLGFSTPFGLLIACVAIFAYLKKPPFVPSSWKDKTIPAATIQKMAIGSRKIFDRLHFLIHPRWDFLCKEPFEALNTLLIIFNCILLALPLPIPFTNTLPGYSIFFMSLALLEEDGLFVLLSYLLCVVTVVYFALLAKGLEASWRVLF